MLEISARPERFFYLGHAIRILPLLMVKCGMIVKKKRSVVRGTFFRIVADYIFVLGGISEFTEAAQEILIQEYPSPPKKALPTFQRETINEVWPLREYGPQGSRYAIQGQAT